MPYSEFEKSAFGGEPFELYTFIRGDQRWRYTSGSNTFEYFNNTSYESLIYQAAAIKRGNLAQGQEAAKNALTLTVPMDLPLLDAFRGIPDFGVMTINLERLHVADYEQEVITIWTGRVLGVKFSPDQGHAEINCEPVMVSLKRNGLRRLYSKNCSHVLYGLDCKVVATPVAAQVIAVDQNRVTLNIQMVAYEYAGGWLQTPTGEQRAMITENDEQTVTLIYPIEQLVQWQPVEIYMGCDHSLETCNTKFNNILNYGGFPWIPNINPFDTGVF